MQNKPKLSIVIPVYNEKDTIDEIVKRVQNVEFEKEIIIVDDCGVPPFYVPLLTK